MSIRIMFINPIGTDMYDDHMASILNPIASPDTELVVCSLQGVPKTPHLPSPAVFHNQLFQTVIDAQKEGFDGIVIACCADPGLNEAKSLVDIPITAPFEAVANTAPALGRLTVVVTLPPKEEYDLAHEYGTRHCLASVRAVPTEHLSSEESTRLFDEDPNALRRLVLGEMERAIRETGIEEARRAVHEDKANVIFFACTHWAGMLGPVSRLVPAIVLDPLITPLKYIELLAEARNYYSDGRQDHERK